MVIVYGIYHLCQHDLDFSYNIIHDECPYTVKSCKIFVTNLSNVTVFIQIPKSN